MRNETSSERDGLDRYFSNLFLLSEKRVAQFDCRDEVLLFHGQSSAFCTGIFDWVVRAARLRPYLIAPTLRDCHRLLLRASHRSPARSSSFPYQVLPRGKRHVYLIDWSKENHRSHFRPAIE